MTPIAFFHSPFTSKFGIPKQSGLVKELHGEIVFTPEYRNEDFIRGLEDFDYLWIIWEFSANGHKANSPVVRPPLLGGNKRMGVFATRSPYRPNPIGLSSVKIVKIEVTSRKGPVIHVSGADLMDGTPIYDIKPYIAYADSHPDAKGGFTDSNPIRLLDVEIDEAIAEKLGKEKTDILRKTLAYDPRPHYHNNPDKIYGMPFFDYDIKFRVEDGKVIVLR